MLSHCARAMFVVAILAAVSGVVAVAPAQTPTQTNFELVRDAASIASEELVKSLEDIDLEYPVSLRSVGTHAGNFLVENALSGVLTQSGRRVRTKPDASGPILEFEVVDLGVAYTRVHRRAWLGAKKVEREARARLFARLIDQDAASILWADQAEAKVFDEVRHEDLAQLEEKSGSEYLKATLPPRRWNKIVEPVVVTGIVVGLIVLFFSNQDASR